MVMWMRSGRGKKKQIVFPQILHINIKTVFLIPRSSNYI